MHHASGSGRAGPKKRQGAWEFIYCSLNFGYVLFVQFAGGHIVPRARFLFTFGYHTVKVQAPVL